MKELNVVLCILYLCIGNWRALADERQGSGCDHRSQKEMWLAGSGAYQIRPHD